MTDVTHIVGVDPGLVHTGCVRMVFTPDTKSVVVEHLVVVGPDSFKVRDWVCGRGFGSPPMVFIEDYRQRHHYSQDVEMVAAVREMRRVVPGMLLSNTGVKKVVRRDLMDLLGVWRFKTTTHNQDLRSAAYIGLYGMLKHEISNQLLADVVHDHLAGHTWTVQV